MTENEANTILKAEIVHHPEYSIFAEALGLAIQALEKQIPKKPMFNGTNWYRCVNGCEIHKKQFEKDWYCPKCGQKLDWSDEE